MSKMDGLRAMREARYQRAASRPAGQATRPAAAEGRTTRSVAPRVVAVDEDDAPALCGHKAISGRTCTREAGHASKSHRYS